MRALGEIIPVMRIGVDLGGTKIEAIALGKAGHVLGRPRVATPRDDCSATLAAFVKSALPGFPPKQVLSDTVGPPVLPPKHGHSGGVSSGAWLWHAASPEAVAERALQS